MIFILNKNSITCKDFEKEKYYTLDDFLFYINKSEYKYTYYLLVKDKYDNISLIKLKRQNSTNPNYYNFVCEYSNVKVNKGSVKICLIGVNKDTLDIEFSTNKIDVLIDNRLYEYKTYVSEILKANKEASEMYKEMLNLYNKTVDITKLNISMIEEGGNGDT